MRTDQWDSLDYFFPHEFEHPEMMDYEFLKRLDRARRVAGVKFVLNSTYREGDDKSHGRGLAADIRCLDSVNRLKIVSSLVKAGFTRIGVYDKHIHVDSDKTLPQNVMWLGVSK